MPNIVICARRSTLGNEMGRLYVINVEERVTIPKIVHSMKKSVMNVEMVGVFRRISQRKTKQK